MLRRAAAAQESVTSACRRRHGGLGQHVLRRTITLPACSTRRCRWTSGRGFTAIARPWAWQRPDGTSTFQWYQLQVRYQSRTRVPVRVDAGIITSPLGSARCSSAPISIRRSSPVFYYVAPLPRFDMTFDGLNMMSAGYPLGAIVATSGARWDLRGGVTDSTPARPRVELKSGQRPAMPQVDPRRRLHAAGRPADRRRIRARAVSECDRHGSRPPAPRSSTLEGEYAFNQTRLSGEWVTDRFGTTPGPSIARSFYLQGVQTITPRLFGAARVARAEPPPLFVSGISRPPHDRGAHRGLPADAGMDGARRILTASAAILEPNWDNQAAVSIVWAQAVVLSSSSLPLDSLARAEIGSSSAASRPRRPCGRRAGRARHRRARRPFPAATAGVPRRRPPACDVSTSRRPRAGAGDVDEGGGGEAHRGACPGFSQRWTSSVPKAQPPAEDAAADDAVVQQRMRAQQHVARVTACRRLARCDAGDAVVTTLIAGVGAPDRAGRRRRRAPAQRGVRRAERHAGAAPRRAAGLEHQAIDDRPELRRAPRRARCAADRSIARSRRRRAPGSAGRSSCRSPRRRGCASPRTTRDAPNVCVSLEASSRQMPQRARARRTTPRPSAGAPTTARTRSRRSPPPLTLANDAATSRSVAAREPDADP